MKDNSYYFKHDCNARQDEKILALRMKHGWEGYGLYWALIERLRESANYSCVCDYNLIAYDLRSDANKIKSIIEDFRLFDFATDENRGKLLYSRRLLEDMNLKDDAREAKVEAGKKGAEAKKKKAEPKQSSSTPQADLKHTLSSAKAELKQTSSTPQANRKEEEKKKNIHSSDEEGGAGGQNGKRFTPPCVSDVREYIQEKGYNLSADAFIDHYTSNGWMVGRNKMKDWKAAVRNWNSRQDEYARPNTNTNKNNNNNANDEW